MKLSSRRKYFLAVAFLFTAGFFLILPRFLPPLGRFLIKDGPRDHADAVVVLYTGVDYYPRLMEAAALYRSGAARRVVINGNRKNDALREIEALGFDACCPWHADSVRILEILGVPRERVITLSAEDVFDSITEAKAVAPYLLGNHFTRIIITTSKFHTRRALHIWNRLYGDRMTITGAAAEHDEFDPDRWWHEGRQIRWVLSEYGAWIYYFWQTAFDSPA